MPMERLMTNQELAELVRVPVATVRAWRYKNEGPAGIRVGRHVRYRESEVQRWLESKTTTRSA